MRYHCQLMGNWSNVLVSTIADIFPATEHHSRNNEDNGALSGKWLVKNELHFILMTQTMDDNSHLSLLIMYHSFIYYEFHVLPTCLRQMCFEIM